MRMSRPAVLLNLSSRSAIAAAVATFAFLALSAHAGEKAAVSQVQAAAMAWLALIDAEQCAESWDEAAPYSLRDHVRAQGLCGGDDYSGARKGRLLEGLGLRHQLRTPSERVGVGQGA